MSTGRSPHRLAFGDPSPSFADAVSLIAALEGLVASPGHHDALPLLGLARAELTELGQRAIDHFDEVAVSDVRAGLRELETLLTAMLSHSQNLHESLQLDAARNYIRRAQQAAVTGSTGNPR